MKTRRIGSLEVSVVGLGCNNFGGRIDAARTDAVVGAALDAGITLFDTADIYGGTLSEQYLGQALGGRRDEVVVATKFGMPYQDHPGGGDPAYVRRAVEDSLRRLGTDRIDLYQLHAPDPRTPVAETLGALDELVRKGTVREIGCSNFSAEQVAEADSAARATDGARFVSVQNHYNLLHREPEAAVLPECQRLGLAFLPYFPLAYGLLTGKYRSGEPAPEGTRIAGMPAEQAANVLSEQALSTVAALGELAEAEGHSVLELAIAWLLSRPTVASVIAGATRPEQVQANAAAADWALDAGLLARVDQIAPPG
jgi:aryl-alcohol dehydrogenase-like predicted oxidoreductase